jgi:hypothetical protein
LLGAPRNILSMSTFIAFIGFFVRQFQQLFQFMIFLCKVLAGASMTVWLRSLTSYNLYVTAVGSNPFRDSWFGRYPASWLDIGGFYLGAQSSMKKCRWH